RSKISSHSPRTPSWRSTRSTVASYRMGQPGPPAWLHAADEPRLLGAVGRRRGLAALAIGRRAGLASAGCLGVEAGQIEVLELLEVLGRQARAAGLLGELRRRLRATGRQEPHLRLQLVEGVVLGGRTTRLEGKKLRLEGAARQ